VTSGALILCALVLFAGLIIGGLLGFALRDHLAELITRDLEPPARWDLWGR
jgi:hypothetical protein